MYTFSETLFPQSQQQYIKPSLEESQGEFLRGLATSPVFTYIHIGTLTKRRNLYSSDGVSTTNLGIDTMMINKPGIHMLHVGKKRIFKCKVSVSRTAKLKSLIYLGSFADSLQSFCCLNKSYNDLQLVHLLRTSEGSCSDYNSQKFRKLLVNFHYNH